ncbi:MAG TPA: alpha/beta hydrolase [Herpetosiphonaceae bacterium]
MPFDPQVEILLQAQAALGTAPVHTLSVAEARAQQNLRAAADAPLDPVASVVARTISTPDGDIPARIYTPDGAGPFPILVYIHGGGWVLCSLDTHDRECRALCRRAQYVVVSVDYRLAPEHKFPGPIYDCLAALRWVLSSADELNGDPARVVLGGDSAGGNLTAAVTLLAREQGLGPLAGQLLIYPVTQHYSASLHSYAAYAEGYGLTRDEMIWFWDHYLQRPEQAGDPLASPLQATDLSGLPRALVLLAELDVLYDEGEQYARRLAAAGVPTEMACYPGTIHGFVNMSAVLDAGQRALDFAAIWLRSIGRRVNE